ncbi:unnamed protein product [Leuciscus chuanchicus]
MDAQKLIKPAKFIKGSKEKNIPREVGGKGDPCVMEHDYVMDTAQLNKRDRTIDSLPTTPVKNPAGKKPKPADDGDSEVSNNAILQAILDLEKRVDVQLADLKEQTKQSSVMIASLAKAVQFNAEEMKECKKKVEDLKKQNDQLCKDNNDLKNRSGTNMVLYLERQREAKPFPFVLELGMAGQFSYERSLVLR